MHILEKKPCAIIIVFLYGKYFNIITWECCNIAFCVLYLAATIHVETFNAKQGRYSVFVHSALNVKSNILLKLQYKFSNLILTISLIVMLRFTYFHFVKIPVRSVHLTMEICIDTFILLWSRKYAGILSRTFVYRILFKSNFYVYTYIMKSTLGKLKVKLIFL